MLNILPGRLQTNLVLPLGPTRCRVVFQYFYTDPDAPVVGDTPVIDDTTDEQD